MSEITKLYENAGVDYEDRYNNCTLNKEGECELKCSCDICKYSEEIYIYPPFTAEKQIELIKWLCKRGLLNVMYSEDKDTYRLFNYRCLGAFCYDIATAIATLVQCELDFCTLEEKQQVKGILE